MRGRLCVPGLIALLIGSSFLFAKTLPRTSDEQRATGGMQDPEAKRNERWCLMGPYTPRELYPSLMQISELSPEKRTEVEFQSKKNS